MKQPPGWGELEPQGLGHDLLKEDWAPWARDDLDAEARHTWHVKPRVDRGYHGDPPEVFWFLDRIVAVQRRERTTVWRVVAPYYLGEREPWAIVRELNRATWPEERVRTTLVQFCALVEREWRDWKEGQRS